MWRQAVLITAFSLIPLTESLMPTPNRLDPSLPASDLVARINENMDYLDDRERTQVMKSAGVPQILTGYQKAGFNGLDYGTKVSKINPATSVPYDVTTATDDQLAFSSGWDSLKVIYTSTINTSNCGPSTSVIDTANLGPISTSAPAFLAYIKDAFGYSALPSVFIGSGTSSVVSGRTYLSSGNVMFEVTTVNNDPTFSMAGAVIRYYLLRESAN